MKALHLVLLVSILLIAGCASQQGDKTNDTSTPAAQGQGETGLQNASETGNATEGASLCTDSDGGLKPDAAGAVTIGNLSTQDSCIDPSTLAEYICIGGGMGNVTIPCGNGNVCEDGRCMENETLAPVNESQTTEHAESGNQTIAPSVMGCSGPHSPDSSVQTNVTYNGAPYSDVCIDFHTVKEYFCNGDLLKSENHPCDPGYGCRSGVCEYQQPTCTEDDSGNDTAKQGRTVVVKGMAVTFEKSDECLDDGTLIENYCLANGSAASDEIPCGSGFKCLEGRCIKSKCTDSDGGINIYKAGTAKSGDVSETDGCEDDHHIVEYYCYGDMVKSKVESCGDGYFCDPENDKCMEGHPFGE